MGAEECVEAVGHAFDLFDFAVFDGSVLNYAAVGGGEDGIGVRIQGPGAGFETTVEEGCEIGVGVEIVLFDL